MANPDPTPGAGRGHGAALVTCNHAPADRGSDRSSLRLVSCALAMVAALPLGVAQARAEGAATPRLRALSADEVDALWASRPVRSQAHRSYIFIDEEDIVEGTELPLFRVEDARYGTLRRLQHMAEGDPGATARIADLAPELARETEMMRRADAAFYTRRAAGGRTDTPDHPDVLVGALTGLMGRGR